MSPERVCPECGLVLHSRVKLRAHMVNVHGAAATSPHALQNTPQVCVSRRCGQSVVTCYQFAGSCVIRSMMSLVSAPVVGQGTQAARKFLQHDAACKPNASACYSIM